MVALIVELLNLYLLVLLAAMVVSWLPIQDGTPLASVRRVLWQLTNPVLAPIRRMLPGPRVGGMALDLSPIVVFIAILVIQRILIG